MMLRLHRWIALTLGGWFVFLGVTGSVLVFWQDIAAGPPAPDLPGPSLSMAALLEAAQAHWPAAADIYRLMPPRPGEAMRIHALLPDGAGPDRRHMLWLDPVTGAVLAEEAWGDRWIHGLYNLHAGNFGGSLGAMLVGYGGIAMLVLIAAGAWMWTRQDPAPRRESLRPVSGLRGLRRRRNLHRAIGVWLAVPLGIAACTGLTLRYPETTRAALAPLDAEGAELQGPRDKPAALRNLTLDEAADRAEALLPGWRTAWIDLPPHPGTRVSFALVPNAPGIAAPARVTVDLRSRATSGHHADRVETMRAWFMALHNGHAFGGLHRGFVVALGLAPGFLGVTGLLIWLRRRRNAVRLRATPTLDAASRPGKSTGTAAI